MAKAKTFRDWFNKQSKLIQVILLLIPVVNWITEILVRWSKALKTKNGIDILVALVVTIFGIIPIFGWLDLAWILIFNHLLLG